MITLSGQVTSFIVEFLTSMIYLAQIFYHDLADPSHQPILLIFASTIISCVQLGSSHELKRFVKSLIERWKKKVVFEFILAKYKTDLYNILAWLNANFNYDFFKLQLTFLSGHVSFLILHSLPLLRTNFFLYKIILFCELLYSI